MNLDGVVRRVRDHDRARAPARRRPGAVAALACVLVATSARALGQGSAPPRTATAPTAREADERLAAWLERQGLDRLLALQLEDRLGRESSDLEKRDLAERLAGLLVRCLRSGEVEPDAGAAVAGTLRPLLASVDADEVSLEILRARLRQEERRLERVRLGRGAAGEDAAASLAALAAVVAEAERVRRNFEADLRVDDRRLDRSVGLDAESLLDMVDRKRLILESTKFVQAWGNLHMAMLARSSRAPAAGGRGRETNAESSPRAKAAGELFVALLDTGQEDPKPGDVSVDRRAEEPYASAILGAAISKTLAQGAAAGEPWFALLADSRTAPAIRRSAPGWRLLALLLSRDFVAAREQLEQAARRGPVPPAWARAAVLESSADSVLAIDGAAAFVQSALALLAAQEEIGEVVELSATLPPSALPTSGFVAGYVRGLREYRDAKSGGGAESYRHAAETLLAAARETDAATMPVARASAQQLAAWCLVGAGDHAKASPLFEAAAEALPAPRAAEALWLAAESATRAAAKGGPERRDLEAASERIIHRLLERYPESAFAARAEVARIRSNTSAGRAELARLMAVPRGSPAWPEAIAAAEEVLYRLFRAATAEDRSSLAAQYLDLARQEDAPGAALRRTWLRRRIEAALAIGASRVDDAVAALGSLRSRAAAGEFRIDDLDSELRLRDLQIAAVQGRIDESLRRLAELEAVDSASTFARIGRRSIFMAAQRGKDDAARAATVDLGSRILDDERASMDGASSAAIALAAGRAALLLSDEAPTTAARRAKAMEALRTERGRRPTDPSLLEVLAGLAERTGDDALAVECLGTILSGSSPGDSGWFEARVRQVRILARTNPSAARAVLDQHRALVPDWGPEPWGSELSQLDRRVPAAPAGGAS